MNTSKAFEIVANNDFAREIIERTLNEEPELTPHPDFKNVLIANSPAGFIQPLGDAKQIIWPKGFVHKGEAVSPETALITLKALFLLKHGVKAEVATTYDVISEQTYQFHAPDPPTLHVTFKGQGLHSLPEEDDVFEIYGLSDPELEERKLLRLDVGDASSFADDLIHSSPKTQSPEDRTYAVAIGEIS